MQHLEGSGMPILYIGHMVLKGYAALHLFSSSLSLTRSYVGKGNGIEFIHIPQNNCSTRMWNIL
jgi:hypothetical protein